MFRNCLPTRTKVRQESLGVFNLFQNHTRSFWSTGRALNYVRRRLSALALSTAKLQVFIAKITNIVKDASVWLPPWNNHLVIQSVSARWKSNSETPESPKCCEDLNEAVPSSQGLRMTAVHDIVFINCDNETTLFLIRVANALVHHGIAFFFGWSLN